MSAKDRIVSRIRAHLEGSATPELPAPAPPAALPGGATLVDGFVRRLESVGGVVHRVRDANAAAAALAEIAREETLERLAVSDAPRLAELLGALDSAVEILGDPFDRRALLLADAGLTAVQLAIAETGTLVLDSSAELHRLVSLLPRVHIAVCRADQIVATLGEALARFEEPGPPPTLTFITGPSRTADIELELVVGVHGPEVLHVLLLE